MLLNIKKNRLLTAFLKNFLGKSPVWLKMSMIGILIFNTLLYYIEPTLNLNTTEYFILGWCIILESIFILAVSLKCHPLLGFSLLLIQILFFGLTSSALIYKEIEHNLSVILLIIFCTAFVYFHKNLLNLLFFKLILKVKTKIALSIACLLTMAVLSAFLNALTIIIIIITVSINLFKTFVQYIEGQENFEKELAEFKSFLKNILMHSAIGTAVGGISTIISEPQNFLIAKTMNWDFVTFTTNMLPLIITITIVAIIVCFSVEYFKLFGFGSKISPIAREIIVRMEHDYIKRIKTKEKATIILQAISLTSFIIVLLCNLLEIGIAGLLVIGFISSMNGINDEHELGKSFQDSMPFASLIILFFSIVTMINNLALFEPIIKTVLAFTDNTRLIAFYLANALLSIMSDNVFVATIYMGELSKAFTSGLITTNELRELAIAVNAGTNISSVATPNGQAAFLFLLTSPITKLIGLSYNGMVKMAFPYFVFFTITGLLTILYLI